MLTAYHLQMNEQSKKWIRQLKYTWDIILMRIRTTKYNCYEQHSLYTTTQEIKSQI